MYALYLLPIFHLIEATLFAPRSPQFGDYGPPSDPKTCMNPNSQPELSINDACQSSKTDFSTCITRKAYNDSCVVYCEQFLYWFLGPEVPWPNSACGPDGDCTFNNAKGIAITNSYSFTAGVSGYLADAFKLAFNLGATYTYAEQTSTTQTFSLTKPKSANDSCGYWTFLPYYVSSCGFFLSSEKIAGNHWANGVYFFDDTYAYCGNHNITFGCTNTTYLDENDNAEGVTVFVKTNCITNAHLTAGQDARYNRSDRKLTVLDRGFVISNHLSTSTPTSDEVCIRSCYCAYNRDRRQVDVTGDPVSQYPYEACVNYDSTLSKDEDYYNCKNYLVGQWVDFNGTNLELRTKDIDLLKFYGAISCNSSVAPGSGGSINYFAYYASYLNKSPGPRIVNWTWIPDDGLDEYTSKIRQPYDCFGTLESIGSAMNDYMASYWGRTANSTYNHTTCQDDGIPDDLPYSKN